MATAGFPLWSTTAASNATADPAVNWAEGMAPSAVNNSSRAEMASMAKWRDDFYGITTGLSTGGSSTAYTVTTNSTYASASILHGAIFTITPHTTSGASPTLAVDGLTARALNFSTGVAVPTGALISGTPYFVRYNNATTEFIVIGPSIAPVSSIDINGATAKSSAASTDRFPMYDATGLANKYITTANLFASLTLAGAQMGNGAALNATIAESNATNATTYSIKTLAGSDPSSTDPVLFAFRNATAGTGNYVYRQLTSALSLTISSGSTLGFPSGVPSRLWLVVFDDAGTLRLGVINCLSVSTTVTITPLGQNPIASSLAEGGAGAADSASTFYTGTAVTSKAYIILGSATYSSGVATAGSWNVSPTVIRLHSNADPLPGTPLQVVRATLTSAQTGTTLIPGDNTAPQITEGDEYMTATITPTNAANALRITSRGYFANSAAAGGTFAMALFQGAVTTALATAATTTPGAGYIMQLTSDWLMASGSTSSITFRMRAGHSAAGTTTLNGSAGSGLYGGAGGGFNSFIQVEEIVA